MFTGIISGTAAVKAVKRERGGLTLSVQKPKGWKIKAGQSVSVNGVCSTVARAGTNMVFQYMPETLAKTNLAAIKTGEKVNLEASLRASDPLDGHIVLGHVDAVGKINSIATKGNSKILGLTVSQKSDMKLVAKKGSIAIEGISLTVADANASKFTVHIIPYTWHHTNLGQKRIGDEVNLEFDILAKYIRRLTK